MNSTIPTQEQSPPTEAVALARVPAGEPGPSPANSSGVRTGEPRARTTPCIDALHEVDRPETPTIFAVFCYEHPDSVIGRHVGQTVSELAGSGSRVHLFSRRRFPEQEPDIRNHEVGECDDDDLVCSVLEFTRRACNAFLGQFPGGVPGITLLGYEWSAVPSVSLLHAVRNLPTIASFHSLEWERSDMTGEISWRIAEIELAGLREARTILLHRRSTAKLAQRKLPECAGRIVDGQKFLARTVARS